MNFTRKTQYNRALLLSAVGLFILTTCRILCAQAEVNPVFTTPVFPDANVDSCAVWVAPDAREALLFVTEKEGDRIQIWNAATGASHVARPFLGGVPDSSASGEFDRPNGVWVIYDVPHEGGWTDILLVTDQRNLRVQIFRLPELEYFGEFGTGEIGKGYGISWYQDGADIFALITDNIPPDDFPGKIKKYRLRPDGGRLGADLVLAFGSSAGPPPLSNVESLLADLPNNRLHICGDEGGDYNFLFRLDGTYTDITYGEEEFQSDQEGINLYETGRGAGYLVISDQRRGDDPNEYEIFDRRTLDHLGNFRSPPDGPVVTKNTDGSFLEQRPLPGFPNGAFYAVHDDRNVHVYDWTDIAAAMELEIIALDRPYPGTPREDFTSGSRVLEALWFHDGSWWGALPLAEGLSMVRLEDGTFSTRQMIDGASVISTCSIGNSLALLTRHPDSPAVILFFSYMESQRRYVAAGELAVPAVLAGDYLAFIRERAAAGIPGRCWLARVADNELTLVRSTADLTGWEPGVSLGAARDVVPALVQAEMTLGVVWARSTQLVFSVHDNSDPAAQWSEVETIAALEVASIQATATPAGAIAVLASASAGEDWLGLRPPAGQWDGQALMVESPDAGIVLDPVTEHLHLFELVERAGRRRLEHRQAGFENFDFSSPRVLVEWPAVNHHAMLLPAYLPDAAHELIGVGLGDDGKARCGRLSLEGRPDTTPPITMQHSPTPDSAGIVGGTRVFFRITDDRAGIDRASLKLYADNTEVRPEIRGVPRNLVVTYHLPDDLGEKITLRIEARDLASPPNIMVPFEYTLSSAPVKPVFQRGDINGDRMVDISDAVRLLIVLFLGGIMPPCDDALDSDDSGDIEITDAAYLLGYLFQAGSRPPDPWLQCGEDPTADGVSCEVVSPGCHG